MKASLNGLEAAAETGLGYGVIIDAMRAGELRAKRQGRDWVITRPNLERWLAERRARVAAAVARYAPVGRVAEEVRTWWKGQMRTAQAEAAARAEDFVARYRALQRAAEAGRADPRAAEAFGECMTALQRALARVAHLDALYTAVIGPLEGQAARLATEAEAVITTTPAPRGSGRPEEVHA